MTDKAWKPFARLELEDCAGFLTDILETDRKANLGALPGHRLDPAGATDRAAPAAESQAPAKTEIPQIPRRM